MRVWVVPENDGEAVEILRLLRRQGERILITRQGWGATWAALEPEVQEQLRAFPGEVIGIELGGSNPYGARDVDHHWYPGDDRRNPLSTLEQVAKVLGVGLGRREMLVAANDRGYIPAMKALGATEHEIADIREQDRRAQGVTAEDEARARRDIAAAEWRGNQVLVVCSERVTSAHSDFLYGTAEEILLIDPQEWNYYGPRHRGFERLGLPETEQWCGGSDASGYFGIKRPSPESQRRLRELFWLEITAAV